MSLVFVQYDFSQNCLFRKAALKWKLISGKDSESNGFDSGAQGRSPTIGTSIRCWLLYPGTIDDIQSRSGGRAEF